MPIDPDDEYVVDTYGWWIRSAVGVGGRLVLTQRRLCFLSDSIRILGWPQKVIQIERHEIIDASLGGRAELRAGVPGIPVLSINARSGTYRFQTADAEKIIQRLSEIRE